MTSPVFQLFLSKASSSPSSLRCQLPFPIEPWHCSHPKRRCPQPLAGPGKGPQTATAPLCQVTGFRTQFLRCLSGMRGRDPRLSGHSDLSLNLAPQLDPEQLVESLDPGSWLSPGEGACSASFPGWPLNRNGVAQRKPSSAQQSLSLLVEDLIQGSPIDRTGPNQVVCVLTLGHCSSCPPWHSTGYSCPSFPRS